MIEKGTAIYIPLFGLHYDEKYFPNPEQYIPDRHIENVNAQKLIHFPFGYGPRACIGELQPDSVLFTNSKILTIDLVIQVV